MISRFETSLTLIRNYLKENNSPVVRFLYSEESGKISSLTVPATKIISSSNEKLMSILTVRGRILYPDASTAFGDPCSVQENYCMISNFEEDERDSLLDEEMPINAIISFILPNEGIVDSFHDLRNEIMIEGIKIGIDVICHYTEDNKTQSFSFDSDTLLRFADSIQKMRFLINGIIGSYGQRFDESEGIIVIRIGDMKVITHKMSINPYILIKNL